MSSSMVETGYAATMKAVVAEPHPLLKRHGLRKRRHTFNRDPEDGLVQVVNCQIGSVRVGNPVEIRPAGKPVRQVRGHLGVFLR